MRLNQYIAHSGMTSRRKADDLISNGKVFVNGALATVGAVVDETRDVVVVDGVALKLDDNLVYFLVYKPRGVVSSVSDPDGKPVVVSMVSHDARVYPVGRLDENSEGLLFLTNDGTFAHWLTHPSHAVEKEYQVTVRGVLSDTAIETLTNGMSLGGELLVVDEASVLRKRRHYSVLRLVLHQGKHRQIRRMLGTLGYEVLELARVRIGPFSVSDLKGASIVQLSAESIAQFGI